MYRCSVSCRIIPATVFLAIAVMVATYSQSVEVAGVEARTEAAILVDTIRSEHLYAIGEVADGKGEIFLWDDAVFIAAVTPNREPYVRRFVKNLRASYLMYADVPRWDTLLLEDTVRSISELQTAVLRAAAMQGMDTLQAFPFLLIGKIKTGSGHIQFSDDTIEPPAPDGQYDFPLLGKRAQMIGFYTRYEGLHVHFRLQNKYHAGCLRDVEFDADEPIKLFLPKH